jgi:hypothetical protein
MTRPAPKLDPMTEAMSSSSYRIQAMVEGVDQVAIAAERKWGIGRLRLIVSDFLRAKFDEQKDRFDAAMASGDERYIATQVEGMRRAWAALNRSAHEVGEIPLAPQVWECVLPSTGEVVSLVRTTAEAHHVARECRVFTVDEVAVLIDALGTGVLGVKQEFPGATVTGIRRKPPVNWERGDPIPF